VKYLIVNGDDLGLSRGINRGILEAHHHGILTSASLLVDRPWSEEGAAMARDIPRLSLGLHVDLNDHVRDAVRPELFRQLARFEQLVGAPPTHLDSHHNVHRSPNVLPHFLVIAREYNLVLRDFSPARYVPDFYGQSGGETQLPQISAAALVQILKTELHDGVTELGCHPGYVDVDLVSRYAAERECEVRTLCHPSVRDAISEAGIMLVSFRDIPRLLSDQAIPMGAER
jgi:chitin disaccharide deacetylase